MAGDTNGSHLAQALEQTAARADEMDSATLTAAFDELEATYLPQVSRSPRLQLETKRRVAEWKFKLLSERNTPLEVVQNLRSDIRALGYTDLETEATIDFYFARYCIKQSLTNEAKKTLLELSEKLRKALEEDSLEYRHLKEAAENMLAGLV